MSFKSGVSTMGAFGVWSLSTCLLFVIGATSSHAQLPGRAPQSGVWSIAVSPDGQYLAAGAGWWDQPGEIGVWNLGTRQPLRRFAESLGVASVAFSADGKLLASASWNGHVRVRNWPEGTAKADFRVDGVARVAFAPQGQLLATASESKTVQLWDPALPDPLADLQGDLFRFHCVTFSPDGKRVAAGGGDWKPKGIAQVTIWDVDSHEQVLKLVGHNNAILCLAYSPLGDRIATGAIDGTARLWDAVSGAQLKIFPGHGSFIESVVFTPDGKTLLSGCRDGKVRFWDIDTGKETGRIDEPTASANLCLVSGGRQFLGGGVPKTLKLFDATTHQELATLWDGKAPPEIELEEPAEPVMPSPRQGGSLAGALLAGLMFMFSLVALPYARHKRLTAATNTKRQWFFAEIGAAIAALIFAAVALLLLLLRTAGENNAAAMARVWQIDGKVKAWENNTIAAKAEPNFTDGDMIAVAGSSRLRRLEIDHSEITDQALQHLDRFPNLVLLSAGHTRITDAGMAEIGKLKGLRELRIDKLPLSDAGLQQLSRLTELESLMLDETDISDAGLAHLGNMTKLQKLSLWRTRISDAGTRHLSPLRALKHLSLDETAVSDVGLTSVLELPELTYLSVWKTQVTPGGVNALKGKRPTLKINK